MSAFCRNKAQKYPSRPTVKETGIHVVTELFYLLVTVDNKVTWSPRMAPMNSKIDIAVRSLISLPIITGIFL